jgi:hypothetical protein
MSKKETYCIVKELVLDNGRLQNVILVDGGSEVIEFDNKEEADRLAKIFEANSEKGFKYRAKQI